MCIVSPLALALALLDKGRGPTKPVESSFRADLFSSWSWLSLSSFSPTPPGQDLPACWRGGDTSERINRTNERVRQTAVNGVVGHLRSGSTFGDRSCCCVAGIKESLKKEVQHRRRRQHLLTTKLREIEREATDRKFLF